MLDNIILLLALPSAFTQGLWLWLRVRIDVFALAQGYVTPFFDSNPDCHNKFSVKIYPLIPGNTRALGPCFSTQVAFLLLLSTLSCIWEHRFFFVYETMLTFLKLCGAFAGAVVCCIFCPLGRPCGRNSKTFLVLACLNLGPHCQGFVWIVIATA